MNLFKRSKESFKTFFSLFDCSEYETSSAGAKAFRLPESFAKKIRIAEYDFDNQLFWLSDARTPVCMLEIKGAATEGAKKEDLENYQRKIAEIISLFPRHAGKDGLWTIQMYAKDENDYSLIYENMVDAIDKNLQETQLTKTYKALLKKHLEYVYQDDGIYSEGADKVFRGKSRKTRIVFYRINKNNSLEEAIEEITDIRDSIENTINTQQYYNLNYRIKRIDEKEFFYWMFNKFNLHVEGFKSTSKYLEENPFCEASDERPYGYDFINHALAFPVESNDDTGCWKIGDTYHQYITALELTRSPNIGAVTAEQKEGNAQVNALDNLPLGCEFHICFSPISDYDLTQDFERKKKSASRSQADDANKTEEEIAYFNRQFTNGNYLYPMQAGCFISAKSMKQLRKNESKANSFLKKFNYKILDKKQDLKRLDKFVRFLPANYDVKWNEYYYSSRLTSVQNIARLAPIGYSRMTGSDKPLIFDFNRSGEIIFKNRFYDKSENNHKGIFGTTGAGKSVKLSHEILSLMAIKRPYLRIIDAGRSFEHLVKFFDAQGLSVQKIDIKHTNGLPEVSLQPYAQTKKFIEQINSLDAKAIRIQKSIDTLIKESLLKAENKFNEDIASPKTKDEKDEEEIDLRDYIAEFMTSSLLIATNGKSLEEVGFGDLHKNILYQTLRELALEIYAKGVDIQLLPSNVRDRLYNKSKEGQSSSSEHQKSQQKAAFQLATGFETFLNNPTNKMYFDVPSKPLSNADIIYMELGIFKDDTEANKAPRSLAINSFASHIMTECEQRRHQKRETHFVIDECHIPLAQALTAALLTQCSKMARKVGLVLVLATQNPEDFREDAKKMLGNIATIELLKFQNEKSLEEFCELLGLDEYVLQLTKNISNLKGCHSESFLTSSKYKLLTRCIPFKELLFLVANEIEENAERQKVCATYNCDETAAAFIQAAIVRNEEVNLDQIRMDIGA